MKKDFNIALPSQEDLEKRFLFVRNEILRTNIVIAFRYITFFISMESEYKVPGIILYSIYKDTILYTSAIVESCIHYCIKECIDTGHIKSSDVMPFEWKEDSCLELYKISEDERVCGVVRHRKPDTFTQKTQYSVLNDVAKKIGILNGELFLLADKLREDRNKIHLAGLSKTDDYYEEKDIKEAFSSATQILNAIEKKLIEIRTSSASK